MKALAVIEAMVGRERRRYKDFPVGWLLPNGSFLDNTGSHASTVAQYVSDKTGVDFFALTDLSDPFDASPSTIARLVAAGFPAGVLDDAWDWASRQGWIMFRDNGGTLQVIASGRWGAEEPKRRTIKFLLASGFPHDAELDYDGEETTLDQMQA